MCKKENGGNIENLNGDWSCKDNNRERDRERQRQRQRERERERERRLNINAITKSSER